MGGKTREEIAESFLAAESASLIELANALPPSPVEGPVPVRAAHC